MGYTYIAKLTLEGFVNTSTSAYLCVSPSVPASDIALRGASSPVREWLYCSPPPAATGLLHQGTLLPADFTDRGEDTY